MFRMHELSEQYLHGLLTERDDRSKVVALVSMFTDEPQNN